MSKGKCQTCKGRVIITKDWVDGWPYDTICVRGHKIDKYYYVMKLIDEIQEDLTKFLLYKDETDMQKTPKE